MKLSLLNKSSEDEVEEPEEETEIDKLTNKVGEETGVGSFGRKSNYTRLNTYGYDDLRGGK